LAWATFWSFQKSGAWVSFSSSVSACCLPGTSKPHHVYTDAVRYLGKVVLQFVHNLKASICEMQKQTKIILRFTPESKFCAGVGQVVVCAG
jgi:hypothetical protein